MSEKENSLARSIEQLAHDVENFASQSAAACALRDAARAKVDLTPAVEVLTRALEEATQVPLLEASADALAVHLLNTGAGERLLGLAASLRWGSYLSTALVHTATRGRDVWDVVQLLCAPAGPRPRKLDPLPVLNAYIARDQGRLLDVTDLLVDNNRPLLIRLFRDHLLPRSGLDLTGVLPTLLRLLEEGDPAIAREVTWLTYLASEASMDLSRVFTALEALLTSKDEETRKRAAYSLASAQVRRGAWPEVARLGQHADKLVRGEVAHALCVTLHSSVPTASDALGPLCLALTDRDAPVRALAAECLATAHRKGLPIAPPPSVMDALVAGLRDPVVGGVVAEFFSLVFLKDASALGPWRAALVEACAASTVLSVTRLHRACTATDAAEPPCERCLRLPRHARWTYASEEPPGLSELLQEGSLWRCPTCQSIYRRGYSSEHEDMSFSEEWSLDRLSPTEARAVLAGSAKAWLQEHLEHLLRTAEQRLEHPLRGVREEAAWVLAEHFGAARDLERLGTLLRHPDETVRASMAASLEAQHGASTGWSVPQELLDVLLVDASAAVRRSAATLCVRQAHRQGTPERVLPLLRSKDAAVVVEAVRELRRSGSEGAAVAPFVSELMALAEDADAEVRKVAGWALRDVPKTAEQAQAMVTSHLGMLSAARVELRNEGADHLAALALGGADIGVAMPTLARLLSSPKTAWRANAAVKAALSKCAPVEPVLGALVKGLARKRMEREVDFAETLELAARKQPAALRDAVPAIARCVVSASETHRAMLVRVIQALHAGGVDLSGVDKVLERGLPKVEPYQRESLVPILMAGWLARGDWPRIKGLLRRRLQATGWCVCEALRIAGQGGLDITPVVVDLVVLFESRNEHARGYPLKVLEEHFGRTQAKASEVIAGLRKVRQSPQRDRLLARLAPAKPDAV